MKERNSWHVLRIPDADISKPSDGGSLILKKYVFRFPIPLDEAKEHLRQIVSSEKDKRLQLHQKGNVSKLTLGPGRVIVNSFYPIFVGDWREKNGNAELSGYFRMNIFVILLLVSFFLVVLTDLFNTLQQPDVRPGYIIGWKDHLLQFDLMFLGIFIAMAVVGWLAGRSSRQRIIGIIQQSTEEN